MCSNTPCEVHTSSCMKTGSPAAARARTSVIPLGGSSNTTGPLPRALPSAMATARPARLSPAGQAELDQQLVTEAINAEVKFEELYDLLLATDVE